MSFNGMFSRVTLRRKVAPCTDGSAEYTLLVAVVLASATIAALGGLGTALGRTIAHDQVAAATTRPGMSPAISATPQAGVVRNMTVASRNVAKLAVEVNYNVSHFESQVRDAIRALPTVEQDRLARIGKVHVRELPGHLKRRVPYTELKSSELRLYLPRAWDGEDLDAALALAARNVRVGDVSYPLDLGADLRMLTATVLYPFSGLVGAMWMDDLRVAGLGVVAAGLSYLKEVFDRRFQFPLRNQVRHRLGAELRTLVDDIRADDIQDVRVDARLGLGVAAETNWAENGVANVSLNTIVENNTLEYPRDLLESLRQAAKTAAPSAEP